MKFTKHFMRLNLVLLSSVILISCGSSNSNSDGNSDDIPVINLPVETEPNDTAETANGVTVNSDDPVMAAIGNLGIDTDYFSFVVDTTGALYVINPSVLCDIDQEVWLYDTDGVTALIDGQDDDNGIGPDNSESNCETIFYTFDSMGTYFLRVQELDQTSEGTYGVQIILADEAEPNNSFGTATAITIDAAAFTATIGNGGLDTDYFSFVVDTAGVQYTINPSVGCSIDQEVWLYDTDGVTPLVDGQDSDNGIGPDNSEGNCETIFHTFDSIGTYFFRVQDLSQDDEGIYGVQVSISPT